jgi:hypothetical protein
MELVEESLDLAQSRDTLVAIFGVAARIARDTSLNYSYGLWHDVDNRNVTLTQLQ